jgi:hypothetical protein
LHVVRIPKKGDVSDVPPRYFFTVELAPAGSGKGGTRCDYD